MFKKRCNERIFRFVIHIAIRKTTWIIAIT
jgi:hypothetical protein